MTLKGSRGGVGLRYGSAARNSIATLVLTADPGVLAPRTFRDLHVGLRRRSCPQIELVRFAPVAMGLSYLTGPLQDSRSRLQTILC